MSKPKYCDDPDNCTYSDCPTAFCDRNEDHSFDDVPVLTILKRHLETSVHYQQVASKVGNPEGYAYVKIPDWEVRQIIEFLEHRNKEGLPSPKTQ